MRLRNQWARGQVESSQDDLEPNNLFGISLSGQKRVSVSGQTRILRSVGLDKNHSSTNVLDQIRKYLPSS